MYSLDDHKLALMKVGLGRGIRAGRGERYSGDSFEYSCSCLVPLSVFHSGGVFCQFYLLQLFDKYSNTLYLKSNGNLYNGLKVRFPFNCIGAQTIESL